MHGMANTSEARSAKLDRASFRRVLRFARPYRRSILAFIGILSIAAALGLVPPLLFGRIIDHAIADRDRALLNWLAGFVVVAALIDAGLSLVERSLSARIGESVIYDLRVALFDHVQRLPISFFTRSQTGALISRMNNDVIGAQRALTGTLGSVVSNIISLGFTLIVLFIIEWRLTLVALILLPLFLIPAKRVGGKLALITRESMDLNASMNTTMTERFNVAGAMLVKLFGRHDDERDEFAGRAGRVRDIGIRSAVYSRTFVTALTLVGAIGTAAVYWIGGHLVISGSLSIGDLAAMSLMVVRIYGPLTSLTNARVDIMTALVSFDRVFEVLDAPNPLTDRPDAAPLPPVRGEIEFDHVTFRYPRPDEVVVASLESAPNLPANAAVTESPETLSDIDLVIEPGQLVAVVGPSGAGKSTLTSLVPRMYDVSEGAIRIDGHDVRDVTQDSLRKTIGVVSQDPHLFHDTVMHNLLYARPDATAAEVEAACRAARIHDVIEALPSGYDTTVGERGYRLSGGEKQRLAIARMLLKNPAVVILDEATSHLDSENEALVQDALALALEGRTAIVVAHRLSTITSADLIVVLDRGRIVERGTHEQLHAAGGLYAELYDTLVRAQVPVG